MRRQVNASLEVHRSQLRKFHAVVDEAQLSATHDVKHIAVGMRVVHERRGAGVISDVSRTGLGHQLTHTVSFDSGEVHRYTHHSLHKMSLEGSGVRFGSDTSRAHHAELPGASHASSLPYRSDTRSQELSLYEYEY